MWYRGFLSYSHLDRIPAKRLHHALESYRAPKTVLKDRALRDSGRLSPIFRDRDELPSASDLSVAVNEALESSDALIVVCSPNAVASRWVNEEIHTFRALGKGDRIYCYIVDGEPGAGGELECFPGALLSPDPSTGEVPEPVAADARRQGDGRRFAMLKIAAALLGVGFDALRQRDLHRRQRRLVGVTVSSIVIAAVTLALAVSAILSRNEAERRQAQSEDLVNYMLVELQERLYTTGRLDLTIDINKKADTYFSSLADADFNDETLSQKALGLRQNGEALIDQGQLSSALSALFESLLIMERLSDRNADNNEIQIGLANSYFYVGQVHLQRGEIDQAKSYFETVLPIVNAVVTREPDNADWLLERGYAYTNLGRILEMEGSLKQAQAAYSEVMKTNLQLLELEPDDPQWDMEVGFAHNNLGKLSFAFGQLEQARSHYLKDLAIKERVFQTDTSNNVWRQYQASSRYFIGQLLAATGELADAEEQLSLALEDIELLISISPDATNLIVRKANIKRELAGVYDALRKTNQGLSNIQESVVLLEKLSNSDFSNAGWRRDLSRSLTLSADLNVRHGNQELAQLNLSQTKALTTKLLQQEPTNLETHQIAVNATLNRALLVTHTDPAAATIFVAEAMGTLSDYFSDSSDPRVLELNAIAFSLNGQIVEFERIQNRLASMGYVSRRIP